MNVLPILKQSNTGKKIGIHLIDSYTIYNRKQGDTQEDPTAVRTFDKAVYIGYEPHPTIVTDLGGIKIPGIIKYIGKGDYRYDFNNKRNKIDSVRALKHKNDLLSDLLEYNQYECAIFGYGTNDEVCALEANLVHTVETKYNYIRTKIGVRYLKTLPSNQLANKQKPQKYFNCGDQILKMENQWR